MTVCFLCVVRSCDVLSWLLCYVEKLTGRDLTYSTIVGKPSEITMRFAEHVLAKTAYQMNLPSPQTLYMIGSVY